MRLNIGLKIVNPNYSHRPSEVLDMKGTLSKSFALSKLESYPDDSVLSYKCLCFLRSLTRSTLLSDHILYIRRMDERTKRVLKDTILVSEVSVAYCHIISAVKSLQFGFRDDLHTLQCGSELLVSHLDS